MNKMINLYFILLFLITYFFIAISHSSNNVITIHIIPHSHVDPMWLMTSDEYSLRTNVILKEIIHFLYRNKRRTFVWESPFFLNHFMNTIGASETLCTKPLPSSSCMTYNDMLHVILDRQQLEIVGGGWISQDEALSDFSSSYDNLLTGRHWIHSNLGPEHMPSTAWFIDSFGHSASTSHLLSGLDYKLQVLNRVPDEMKTYNYNYGPQMLHYYPQLFSTPFTIHSPSSWGIRGGNGMSQKLETQSTMSPLATIILPDHYSVGNRINMDSRLSQLQIHDVMNTIMNRIATLRKYDDSDSNLNFYFLMGDDFTFRRAETAFANIDKLMHTINTEYTSLLVFAKYSTPRIFLESISKISPPSHTGSTGVIDYFLNSEFNPIKYFHSKQYHVSSASGHLLPYSDSYFNDWTGFYGTRPALKQLIKLVY
jgi:hypothetical protein